MSDELMRRLNGARQHLDPGFGATRVEQGLSELPRRIARVQRRRRAGLTLAGVAVVALVFGVFSLRGAEQLAHGPSAGTPALLETQDGSRATRLSAETQLLLERDAHDEVALNLARGRGHFAVTRNPRRAYRVRAGQVEVQVLGTAFEVERLGARARVRVEHGVVKVRWPGGERVLHAGERGLFPPAAPEPRPAATAAAVLPEPSSDAVPAQELAPAPVEERDQPSVAPRERWRALARAGKHKEAFGSLGQRPVDDLAGLLLAADAARLSGHPREAARHLERLVQRYPASDSAHLAAFTLGRLALYELKRPALAARSFAQAYELNARGPMAEDALAREAEAYHRAGDAERAKNAAERYLQRYPDGARRTEVGRYLDPAP